MKFVLMGRGLSEIDGCAMPSRTAAEKWGRVLCAKNKSTYEVFMKGEKKRPLTSIRLMKAKNESHDVPVVERLWTNGYMACSTNPNLSQADLRKLMLPARSR